MMSKRATMPLMIAVHMAPMAWTMAMMTLPIVRKMDLIWQRVRSVNDQRGGSGAWLTQETTAPMVTVVRGVSLGVVWCALTGVGVCGVVVAVWCLRSGVCGVQNAGLRQVELLTGRSCVPPSL